MIILALDTSTRYAGVGLVCGDRANSTRIWRSEQNHGRELLPRALELLSEAGIAASNLTHIAVALGPGGFSALRVGISAAIGLSLPKSLPVIGVSTFDIEFELFSGWASQTTPVIAAVPAGRGELAWAAYEATGTPVATGLSSPDRLVADATHKSLFCGEGALQLAGLLDPARILCGSAPTRSPLTLADIAVSRLAAGTPLAVVRPVYAREPSTTSPPHVV